MLRLLNMDPVVLLIRLLLGCLIMITWWVMPAPFRIGSLMTLTFLLYHWRVYHAPVVQMLQAELRLQENEIR